jgi:hypothetical protein
MVKHECFSKAEAEERVGRCIESLIEFSGGREARPAELSPPIPWMTVGTWSLSRT